MDILFLQQKLKEEKEAKRAHLDGRHDYILSIVASCADLEKAEVEDAILEGTRIDRIDKFFAVGGFHHLMFYYQDVEASEAGLGPAGANPHSAKHKKAKVFITEGKDVALTGICVFFIRCNPSKAITPENVHQVNLKKCDTFDLKNLKGPADYLVAANSMETLEPVETCMKVWIKQIEQVIAENDQLRKEADDLGPRAELGYWKRRLSKFDYLLDQLKTSDVKAALGVLTAAKSKLLKSWWELDSRITDATNEAKDNVKYLYTLEKCCDPLYNSDPVTMVDAIPGLIHAIKMIHSISRYYNTSEKITSLFVKVTNQMITACKAYITKNNTATIWDQPQDEIIEKIHAAIRLKQHSSLAAAAIPVQDQC
ncbi:UNVERIFIED_CONTAM: Dynein heavy chain 5, axonemal [Gekko kuhli]